MVAQNISCHDTLVHVSARATPLTHTDLRALAQFRFELRRFLHFSERAAYAAGLEPQQHQLLLALGGLPDTHHPATIGAIAEWLQVQPNTAVELVDRAATRGLIRRAQDPHDRRRVLVSLTDGGESILRDLSVQHRAELQTAAPVLLDALQAVVAQSSPASVAQSSQVGRVASR
jgi:DNA-binding MarR family transcriptional regulator